jgi:cytochrome c biogenesis protein CcdA
MDGFHFGMLSALWLGILTSVSPCPLATNIVAISYIGKRIGKPNQVLLSGFMYTLGRTLTYLLLGAVIVSSVLSAPVISSILQKYMNKILGPVLILAGMVLLNLLQLNYSGLKLNEYVQKKADSWGIGGALLLGCMFALSFCPTSAALFFGSLIPIAVKYESGAVMPSLYGIGTGLPVFGISLLLALSAGSIGKAFDRITLFEKWARYITGIIFIIIGIYFSLRYILLVR